MIDGPRYVSRTLEGASAGSEIWTRVIPAGADATDIEVEFQVPGVSADAAPKLGAAYVKLYTQLWDEDEAMMRRRTSAAGAQARDVRRAARRHAARSTSAPRGGARARAVRGRASPAATTASCARAASWWPTRRVCPHWLGPLEDAPAADGSVRCPWHGYRFDLASGRGCDAAPRLRLPPAPRVALGADGRARLEP